MYLDVASRQIDRHALLEVIVVQEVALDDLALIPQREDELLEAVVGVMLHEVPKEGMLADLYHRLGLHGGLFGQTSTQSTGQDHGFQAQSPCSSYLLCIGRFRR